MEAFRQIIRVTLPPPDTEVRGVDYMVVKERWHEGLYWLIEGAPWADDAYGFCIQPDGRGNYRFVAVCKTGVHDTPVLHPFSTHGALHGDFTPPREPFDPDNPFAGLVS